MLSSEAVVVRDGKESKVPANQLVPGDIVKLDLGDRVPADLRLVSANNLACQEAALTGEAEPVEKTTDTIIVEEDPMQIPLGDRSNMCFSATLVSQGTGTGLVVKTGDQTEIGTINSMVNQVEKKKTNVLQQIDRVSTWLAVFILFAGVLTFLFAWLRTGMSVVEAFSTALVCAVAMIPEGLEAIVTMTYAWAVSNMAEKNAIIRALPAVETLGSVTTICSDKTGTLTKNEMSLTAFITSTRRFRVNVNSVDQTVSNFTPDDEYLTENNDTSKSEEENQVLSGERNTSGLVDLPHLRKALAGGILCSKCVLGKNGGREGEIGNPTELSILRASYMAGIDVSEMKKLSPIIAEVAFSSDYKFMATIHEPSNDNDASLHLNDLIVHVKGAPDRMLKLCASQAVGLDQETMEPLNSEYWQKQISDLSSHGLRLIALCRGTLPSGSITEGQQLGPEFILEKGEWLSMVGLCAIIDPPRQECMGAIAEAQGAGVRIAMITGDHKDTALAIGKMLGIVDRDHSEAISGPELDAMAEDELKLAVGKYNVFARASPQNKIQIVKALQSQGEVCSMTGKSEVVKFPTHSSLSPHKWFLQSLSQSF